MEVDTGSKPSVPSKVIHFRNVGPEVTQSDLAALCTPFGGIHQVLLLRNKNQALVQMQEISAAVNLMAYYSTVQAQVKGRNVYPQFSSHQELTGERGNGEPASQGPPGTVAANGRDAAPANRILLVTIQNPLYPITVEVLNQVFSPHGTVEKIVIFNKTAGLQALVQYSNVQNAIQAKNALQGQNIYAGSCTLHIQFSNLDTLTVHHNTDKTRDFTNPNLPPGLMGQGGAGGPGQLGQFNQVAHLQQLSQLATLPGMSSLPMMQQLLAQQQPQFGGAPSLANMGMPGSDRCVLLVSNLNTQKADCDAVFNLFSQYGNIVRIKILHNKRDHALVQMGDNIQSTTAMNYLKHTVMFGQTIDVNYSKHSSISATPEMPGQENLTRDYSNSQLNRFVRNAQKNFKYICPPGVMLHVSNLSPSVTKEIIMELFTPFGGISNIKMLESRTAQGGKQQCLLQFFEAPAAIDALCAMHNKVVEGLNIRVAFSKNTI